MTSTQSRAKHPFYVFPPFQKSRIKYSPRVRSLHKHTHRTRVLRSRVHVTGKNIGRIQSLPLLFFPFFEWATLSPAYRPYTHPSLVLSRCGGAITGAGIFKGTSRALADVKNVGRCVCVYTCVVWEKRRGDVDFCGEWPIFLVLTWWLRSFWIRRKILLVNETQLSGSYEWIGLVWREARVATYRWTFACIVIRFIFGRKRRLMNCKNYATLFFNNKSIK